MKNSTELFLFLLSTGTLLLAATQLHYERSHARIGSWIAFTTAIAVFALTFAIKFFGGSDLISGVSESVAICTLAFGFVLFSSETRHIRNLEREQRIDTRNGLPNKRAFVERIVQEASRARRTNISYAVCVFEIDGSEQLSEDQLAQSFAAFRSLVDEHVRGSDFAGMIGDRHLALLAVDVDVDGAKIAAERLNEAFTKAVNGGNASVTELASTTLSCGIALRDEEADPADTLKNAELALFALRRDETKGMRFYNPDEQDSSLETLLQAI